MKSVEKEKKDNWLIEISENLCKGCEICIEFCPTEVFKLSDKLNRKGYYLPIVANIDACTGCRLCDLMCPDLAIILIKKE